MTEDIQMSEKKKRLRTSTVKVCDQTGEETEAPEKGKTANGWFRLGRIALTYRAEDFEKTKLPSNSQFNITKASEAKDFASADALADYLMEVAEDIRSKAGD